MTKGYAHLGHAHAQHIVAERLLHGAGVEEDKVGLLSLFHAEFSMDSCRFFVVILELMLQFLFVMLLMNMILFLLLHLSAPW